MIWAVLIARVPLWLCASLALAEGGTVEVGARREDRAGLLGPFAKSASDVSADGDTR